MHQISINNCLGKSVNDLMTLTYEPLKYERSI